MENSSTPLADYFWIAGVESVSYDEAFPIHNHGQLKESQPESTIAEDGEPEPNPDNASLNNGRGSRLTVRHSRQNSGSRLSRLSFDNRLTMMTSDDLDSGPTASNRSSATIRPVNSVGATNGMVEGSASGGSLLGDFDFDKALFKFAAEREDFLEDLSFSAGAKTQSRAPMINPRAERIRADEAEPNGRRSPLRSLRGSIRRRISFRDMNSMRKQPTTTRPVSNRTC